MVLLQQQSSINQNQKQLSNWDQMRRLHYNQYEELIKQKEFHLQKFQQSSLYQKIFPYFSQGSFLDLDILKKLQALGDYTDEEVESYQKIQPNIRENLNNTFSTTFPYIGLGLGICLQAIPIRFKLSLSHHLGLLIAPMLSEQLYKKFDLTHKHNTLMFLESTINRRLAQVSLENDKEFISKEYMKNFKKNFGNANLNSIYKSYLAL